VARGLVVTVFADVSKYVSGFKQAAGATRSFDREVTALSVDTQRLAQSQVAASTRTIERLRQQSAAYRQMATAAKQGSTEQAVAANLAARAEAQLARETGRAATATRHAAHEHANLARQLDHSARGLLTGTGLMHGFGRSLAFASGGFVAFEGVTRLIRESVDAAREAGEAQRSLAAQMKVSGESFAGNREEIEHVTRSYAKFGFDNDQVLESLTVLERGTGDLSQSFKLQGVTADIARAKNITLAAAATVVAKVFGGQETALRRAVPGLNRNAHGWDLIREAQRKMAGQAAANTTEAERFNAALHDTEEIIGGALLPVLNKYLAQLDKWLTNTENQKKIQDTANAVAESATQIFDTLAGAVGGVVDAYGALQKAADKLPGSFLKTFFGGTLPEQYRNYQRTVHKLARDLHLPFGVGNVPEESSRLPPNEPRAQAVAAEARLRAAEAARKRIEAAEAAAAAADARRLRGRFNVQELKLAQAQLTKTLADDRKILAVEAAITKQQITQAKTLKIRTELTQKLAGITSQIRAIDEQTAADAKARRDAAAEKAKEARDKALAARQQYTTPLGLQVAGARADAFAVLTPDLSGPTGAQVRIAKQVKAAALKAIRSHRLLAQGLIDAWNVVTAANQTLAAALKNKTGVRDSYIAVSSRAITSGLHLTRLQRIALEQRLAQSAAHSGYRPATGYTLGQPIVVHTHVNMDGREVATTVDKHTRRNHQRRGTRR